MREICVSPFCTAFAINGINLQYVLPRLTQDLPSFECCSFLQLLPPLSLSCIDVAQKVRHYAAIIKIATPRGHSAKYVGLLRQ